MLWTFSIILQAIYLLLPATGLCLFATKCPRTLKRTIASAWISGTLLATAILAAYVAGIGGTISTAQIAKTIYFAVGLMLFLKAADYGFKTVIYRIYRLSKPGVSRYRVALAVATRILLFSSFALPWVISAVMVYRPRVIPSETPQSMLRVDYQPVQLATSDGYQIAGWFIPAPTPSSTTAIVCHGLGASKAGMWGILRALHDANINVLTIDLRAHAESGGQLTYFGARESRDVIATLDWLDQQPRGLSEHVVAIGASLGGAAILQVAETDPRIDAVVTIGPYDSLSQLAIDLSNDQMVPPISYLTRWLALPIASLHTGTNLMAVRPGDSVEKIWPRPVMIVHGANDEIIPFSHGKRIYDKAYWPRTSVFTGGTHNGVMDDPQVIANIIEFVLHWQPSPVI